MVARVNGLASGKSVVGLALKDGQLPDGLQAGDHVNLYQVSDASQSCPGTPGSLLASNAVVLGIGAPPAARAPPPSTCGWPSTRPRRRRHLQRGHQQRRGRGIPGSATGGAGWRWR